MVFRWKYVHCGWRSDIHVHAWKFLRCTCTCRCLWSLARREWLHDVRVFSFIGSNLVSLETPRMRGLTVAAVGERCKTIILLHCGQMTAYKWIRVPALATDCSDYRCVPVPCHWPDEQDELVTVQPHLVSFCLSVLWWRPCWVSCSVLGWRSLARLLTRASDGRQRDEDLTRCCHVHDVTGSSRYSRHVFDLEQFGEALDDRQVADLLDTARIQTFDGVPAPRTPTWSYSWDGNQLSQMKRLIQPGTFLVRIVGERASAPAELVAYWWWAHPSSERDSLPAFYPLVCVVLWMSSSPTRLGFTIRFPFWAAFALTGQMKGCSLSQVSPRWNVSDSIFISWVACAHWSYAKLGRSIHHFGGGQGGSGARSCCWFCTVRWRFWGCQGDVGHWRRPWPETQTVARSCCWELCIPVWRPLHLQCWWVRWCWLTFTSSGRVDLLMWLDKFCVPKRIHEGDRVRSKLEGWCRVLYVAGTHDQLNLGGCACLEEASRRAPSCVDANTDEDHVSFERRCVSRGRCGSKSRSARLAENQGRPWEWSQTRSRTFTFGTGTARPPPHNRPWTPDCTGGKKNKDLEGQCGGGREPPPAGLWCLAPSVRWGTLVVSPENRRSSPASRVPSVRWSPASSQPLMFGVWTCWRVCKEARPLLSLGCSVEECNSVQRRTLAAAQLVRQPLRCCSLDAVLEPTFVVKRAPSHPRELSQRACVLLGESPWKAHLHLFRLQRHSTSLDAPPQHMSRSQGEFMKLDSELGPTGLYVDPVLERSQRHHVTFVGILLKAKNHWMSPCRRPRWQEFCSFSWLTWVWEWSLMPGGGRSHFGPSHLGSNRCGGIHGGLSQDGISSGSSRCVRSVVLCFGSQFLGFASVDGASEGVGLFGSGGLIAEAAYASGASPRSHQSRRTSWQLCRVRCLMNECNKRPPSNSSMSQSLRCSQNVSMWSV